MSAYAPENDLILADALADAARDAILPHFRARLDVENKLGDGFDPVTVADRASERAMRDLLDRHVPEDGILGEEYGTKPGTNGRRWVLDPIDGTRAFIAGLPTWTVLIALEVSGETQVGVIDQPHTGERFRGWPGGAELVRSGATAPLSTRRDARLDTAILATTDPYLFEGDERDVFEAVRDRCRLCRFGYDAYAYAMLAAGGIDLVIESGLQPYDVQALIPVVRGAGGVITSWKGGAAGEGGQVIAAANADLHAAALEFLAPAAQ